MAFALSTVSYHLGLPDGSAGVAVSNEAFIGASDESNVLHLHLTADGERGKPVLDLNEEFPGFPAKRKKKAPDAWRESDLESAAQVGELVYWIGSCSRGRDGKRAKEREVLFATRLVKRKGGVKPVPAGKVYKGLLDDLVAAPALKKYRLAESARLGPKEGPSDEPPCWGGLNIESLCAEHGGGRLFIGFRNPIPCGQALLVPLLNAAELTQKRKKKPKARIRAKFGEVMLLDLHGLGLRDMVWWRGRYLILAGYYDEYLNRQTKAPVSRLFQWTGKPEDKPVLLEDVDLKGLNPEALVVFPNKRVLILSDDGGLRDADGKILKKAGEAMWKFRSVWLEEV
ncbi:DUF3616 domain-containing protein [Prosthecobacter sp.]|uniref:DUF3616 domain-containing protein n=1 Tax=Prosthecobacter sp. TaxID=1965333 RepID=UPI003784FE1B